MKLRKLMAIPLAACLAISALGSTASAVTVQMTHGDSTVSGVTQKYTPTAKRDGYGIVYKFAPTTAGTLQFDFTSVKSKPLQGDVSVTITQEFTFGRGSMTMHYNAECFDEEGNIDVWSMLASSAKSNGIDLSPETWEALYNSAGTEDAMDAKAQKEYDAYLSTLTEEERGYADTWIPMLISMTVSSLESTAFEVVEGTNLTVAISFEEKGDCLNMEVDGTATLGKADVTYASEYFNIKSKVGDKLTLSGGSEAKYYSSNTKVATVSSKGVIKMKAKGTVVITVKNGGNTYKYRIKVA